MLRPGSAQAQTAGSAPTARKFSHDGKGHHEFADGAALKTCAPQSKFLAQDRYRNRREQEFLAAAL